jgi:hypothetical protein
MTHGVTSHGFVEPHPVIDAELLPDTKRDQVSGAPSASAEQLGERPTATESVGQSMLAA